MHTCVQRLAVCVAVLAVCKDKRLHPPHGCFFGGEILNEEQSALEANHRLVDRQLTGGVVGLLKVLDQWIKKWSDFEQGIMTWLTFLDIIVVVIQVEELEKEREAVTLDDLLVKK